MIDLDKYTLDLDQWHTPATDYPEGETEDFRIHRGRYNCGTYLNYGIDGYIFLKIKKPIPITYLQQKRGKKWHSWMLDDPPHWRAMEIYAENSRGKVLTTGLGLGLYLQALKSNKNIESVTVIELSRPVIELVEPLLPVLPSLVILQEDFYDFLKSDYTDWDTIMIDLWVAHGVEEKTKILYHNVLPMIPALKLKYPKASITFHGFSTVSDIKHTSKEMTKLVLETTKYLNL